MGTLYASHGARAVLGCFVLLGRDLILYTDGANASAVVAAVVARADIAGIEAQAVSVAAVARTERTRPIVAVATCIAEARNER